MKTKDGYHERRQEKPTPNVHIISGLSANLEQTES